MVHELASATLPAIPRTHRSPRQPRGTVLLMVLGVLALMSIIAVVYAAIGQADRRASSALVKDQELSGQAEAVAEYLTSVIGRDVLSTVHAFEPTHVAPHTSQSAGDRLRRESIDYPSTDTYVSSRRGSLGNDYSRFDPAGTISTPWAGSGRDPRTPSDPWLASTEPTWLGDPDHTSVSQGAASGATDLYLNFHDCRQISNFAPSGNFVNLFNLRGNFRAESGFGVDDAGNERMSENLTLFDAAGNPYTAGTTQQLPFPIAGSTTAEPFRPADWSTNQRWLHRPAVDRDRNPDQREYLPYQLADANGDGFFDSKWFEPVDSYDQRNTRSVLSGDAAGRYRLFIAAHAIDLSALVNVNTAVDFGTAPTPGAPAGLTPADVDLARLLGMSDFYNEFGEAYDGFFQGAGASNYSGYSATVAADVGLAATQALRSTLKTSTLPTGAGLGAGALESPADRASHFHTFGGASTSRTLAAFDAADEIDLRAFGGANDSRRRSRLEAATGGRSTGNLAYSPLRDNRTFDAERKVESNALDGTTDPEAALGAAANPRRLLTTVSGARPLYQAPVVDPVALSKDELRTNIPDMLELAGSSSTAYVAPTTSQVNQLFEFYLKSLSPYLVMRDFQDPAMTDQINQDLWDCGLISLRDTPTADQWKSRALTYGNSMEFAYRSAAHMAVNFFRTIGNAGDSDIQNRAWTLIVDPAVNQTAAFLDAYPWPQLRPADDRMMAPNADVLGLGAGGNDGRAVNIYAVEPQPFLVQASNYIFFVDAAPNNGLLTSDGDEEQVCVRPPNPNPVERRISIDLTRSDNNADLLMELLVFQIHNPFDKPIALTRGTESLFYFEYAGRFFGLSNMSANGLTTTNDLTLPPHETRAYVVASEPSKDKISLRWRDAKNPAWNFAFPPPNDNNVLNAWTFDTWANAEFGTGKWAKSPMLDAGGGIAPVDASRRIWDIQGERISGLDPSQRKTVFLHRVLKKQGETTNDRSNDLIVDRLRDPDSTEATLFTDMPENNIKVSGTCAGDETNGNPFDDEDNDGYAFYMWGTIQRPTGTSPSGTMPPWTIEAKADNAYAFPGGASANKSLTSTRWNASPASDTPWPTASNFFVTYRRFVRDVAGTATRAPLQPMPGQPTANQIKQTAETKTGNPLPTNTFSNANGAPVPVSDRQIVVPSQDQTENPTMFVRSADLLLPLAIGPTFDPSRGAAGPTGYTSVAEAESAWMTLSECFAAVRDLYSPSTSASSYDPCYDRVGHRDDRPSPPRVARLDRGFLNNNEFAAFDDVDGNGVYDASQGDQAVWPFGPISATLLARSDTMRRGPRLAFNGMGSLFERISGRININTAPIWTLRLLPMLSPSLAANPGAAAWARGLFTAGNAPDIASTLLAYRDKVQLNTRPVNNTPGVKVSFRDDADGSDNAGDPDDDDGRADAAAFVAAREQRGIASLAELLLVRDLQSPAGPAHAIDILGNDNMSIGNSGLAQNPADSVVDDYAESLAILNTVIGSVETRSDVFCVWFIIHGYLPSDCEGLDAQNGRPAKVLTPSLARRFVMVVDRSNVIRIDDKPKILLLQELPL